MERGVVMRLVKWGRGLQGSSIAPLLFATHVSPPRLTHSAVCQMCPAASNTATSSRRWCSTTTTTTTTATNPPPAPNAPQNTGVTVTVCNGLPQLTVPLPSRNDRCRFTLRPVTHTVQDLVDQLTHEDHGIDRVVLRTIDGTRISSTIFKDYRDHYTTTPQVEDMSTQQGKVAWNAGHSSERRTVIGGVLQEELSDMGDVRQLVNKLYMALNVDQHQIMKERDILAQIEDLKTQLAPLEKKREDLVKAAERRTTILAWAGLGYMALQFGFLARLTWWEYSWDIMEPVTYFVTYGTAMGAYAYYVLTKQEFLLPDVHDRQFLLCFHKKARKLGLNVEKYNMLKNRLAELHKDLDRLRDPLALNLPHSILKESRSSKAPLAKAQKTIKNLLGLREDK
ncbi:calcium uniporter protein, mitochondrial-like [Portunus trituberculatus]|uniref:calcium uniporter protein, mitochondrial-like n=1 Tax=Portunus trituberculatus TaxID=210409 RepID=UPI001E1D1E53|nr:calcium uniporter protein, mitochondrial-like [Portunus trituberculatus]